MIIALTIVFVNLAKLLRDLVLARRQFLLGAKCKTRSFLMTVVNILTNVLAIAQHVAWRLACILKLMLVCWLRELSFYLVHSERGVVSARRTLLTFTFAEGIGVGFVACVDLLRSIARATVITLHVKVRKLE